MCFLPKIPGLLGKLIERVEVYSLTFVSFSNNLSCQCFLTDALALPVLLDDNQCKDGDTFLDVIISTISPFFKDDCKGEVVPLFN